MRMETAAGVRFCDYCNTRLDDKQSFEITVKSIYPVEEMKHQTPLVVDACKECAFKHWIPKIWQGDFN